MSKISDLKIREMVDLANKLELNNILSEDLNDYLFELRFNLYFYLSNLYLFVKFLKLKLKAKVAQQASAFCFPL